MGKITVKITARNFTYGTKLYGTGGEYPVDEATARWMVKNSKATVIEGFLPEEDDEEIKDISRAQFLAKVKENALEIVEILETAMQEKRNADEAGIADPAKIQMTADMSVKSADDNSEGTSTSDSGDSQSQPESAQSSNEQDTSSDDPDLPEDFPGREVLTSANITKLSQVPLDKEGLMAVEGMTAKLANQIGVKLAPKG